MDIVKNISGWIAEWGILLLCVLLPFFFFPFQWITIAESKVSLIVVLLGIAALGFAIAILIEGRMRLSAGIMLLAGALLPISYSISTLLASSIQTSLVGTGTEQDTLAAACLWFGALALSTLILSGSPFQIVRAIRALFIGASVLALLEMAHLLFPAFITVGGVLAGQTGNPLGDWYQLGIAFGFFLLLSLSSISTPVARGAWRILCLFIALLSFLLLIIASLRDVWVALSIVAVLYILVSYIKEHAHGFSYIARRYSLWIGILVVTIVFSIFNDSINKALPPLIRVESVQVRPSLQGTFAIGQHALTGPTALFFGSGPNTFAQDWGLYKPTSVNGTPFWNTDFSVGLGSIPTSFITLGIAGVLAWGLFLIVFLWMGWRSLYVPKSQQQSGAEPLLLGLFLSSLYLFGFHILYVPGPALSILMFITMGLMLGLASNMQRISSQHILVRSFRMRSILATVLIAIVAFAVLVSSYGTGRVVYAQTLIDHSVVVYNETKDLGRTSDLIARALRTYPQSDRAQRAAVELGVLQLQQLLSQKDAQSASVRSQLQQNLQDTIKHGLAAVSIDNGNYQNWLEIAFLYQQLAGADVSGAYQNAIDAYQKAAAKNPTNPLPLLQLAQLQLLKNNVVSALQNLAAAVKLKPDIPVAYYLASQAYASQGDFKDAIAVAQLVVKYDTTDALGWYNLGAVSYAGGDYSVSLSALQEALKREPQYANALYVLGLDYYKLGRGQDSLATFQQLEQLSPNQPVVANIIANLQAGRDPLSLATSTPTGATTTRAL